MSDMEIPPGRFVVPQEVLDRSRVRASVLAVEKRPFLFNTDLDGVLSAHLLSQVLGWEPIGMCKCAGRGSDRLWVGESHGGVHPDAAYVDMFVVEPGRLVIDQHIVAVDAEHANALSRQTEKVNPNLLWTRTAECSGDHERNYQWKYPFGVFHFICALLEAQGFEIDIKNSSVTDEFNAYDLLLRADDAGRTTAARYRPNALSWWHYLAELGGAHTKALARYAASVSATESDRRQASVQAWFSAISPRVPYVGADASFGRHLGTSGVIDESIQALCDAITGAVWNERFVMRSGPLRSMPLAGRRGAAYDAALVRRELASPGLFSYAFTNVMGPNASTGFSYTCRS